MAMVLAGEALLRSRIYSMVWKVRVYTCGLADGPAQESIVGRARTRPACPARPLRTRRRSTLARSALLSALLVVLGLLVAPGSPAVAAAGDVGIEGPSSAGTSTPTGNKRAESVLWFNDGIWWANMWDAGLKRFFIFRLDGATQTWSNTGTEVERRASTHADVLWDGNKLFVATHRLLNDELPAEPGFPSHLYRYSYDSNTKKYTRDTGFPTVVNNYKTETLTIDKDSRGRLWATWQQDNRIYLNSTGSDQTTWGTPFVLPGSGAVSVDDTSAVLAFGGNRIGVLYSSQTGADGGAADGMYWSVHHDVDEPDSGWSTAVAAVAGSRSADDHMNLKWLDASGGQVYAAVKTQYISSAQDLIQLLVLDTASGVWRAPYNIASVSECPNRVIVLLDEGQRLIRTFATYPAPGGTCTSSGGAIYEKTTSMDAIAFPSGQGTLRLLDADSPFLHNVSSTKQNLNTTTANGARGLVLLAHNGRTARYWHHYEAPPAAPAPTASFSVSSTAGTAPLNVTFTDSSAGSPTSWHWDFGNGTTSTAQHPATTYTTAGSYTVTLKAGNASGSSTATQTITVDVAPAPTAAFAASPTGGPAPLSVAFTDTSAGSPTRWSWNFGNGSTSALQHPTTTYTTAGTYTVTLTASNASGSSTATQTITVDQPLPLTVTITEGPASSTTSSDATFRFRLSESATTQCRLDDKPFKACTSPVTYSGVKKGKHTFEVLATAADDGATASARWSWTRQ